MRRLAREDLLELCLEPFLDKGWDYCVGVVGVSEIKTMGVRDHGVKGALHVGKGLFHGIEGFLLFRQKTVAAVGKESNIWRSVLSVRSRKFHCLWRW